MTTSMPMTTLARRWELRTVTALLGLTLFAAPVVPAAEERGATLRLERLDGERLEGELLAVKGERLVLLLTSGAGAEVGIRDVARLGVKRRHRVGRGIAKGMLWGGLLVGGLAGVPLTRSSQNEFGDGTLVFFTLLGGVSGALVGAVAGLGSGSYEWKAMPGKSEKWLASLLMRLQRLARFRIDALPAIEERPPSTARDAATAEPCLPQRKKFSRWHLGMNFVQYMPSVTSDAADFVRRFRFEDPVQVKATWETGATFEEGNNIIRPREFRCDFSLGRRWALGVVFMPFPSQYVYGEKSGTITGQEVKYYDWGLTSTSRSCFLALSYFLVAPGDSARRNAIRIQAGIGASWSRVKYWEGGFIGRDGTDYSRSADLGHVGPVPLSALAGAEAFHYFSRNLSLALEAGYRSGAMSFSERRIIASAAASSMDFPGPIAFTVPRFELRTNKFFIGLSLGLHF